jgi:hypothetical protein
MDPDRYGLFIHTLFWWSAMYYYTAELFGDMEYNQRSEDL